MQVILKKDVQNIGEAGELVNVKDGYARNFLIPKNFAEIATEGALKNREQNLARIKAKQEKLHQEALAKAAEIEKLGQIEQPLFLKVADDFIMNVARKVVQEKKKYFFRPLRQLSDMFFRFRIPKNPFVRCQNCISYSSKGLQSLFV